MPSKPARPDPTVTCEATGHTATSTAAGAEEHSRRTAAVGAAEETPGRAQYHGRDIAASGVIRHGQFHRGQAAGRQRDSCRGTAGT